MLILIQISSGAVDQKDPDGFQGTHCEIIWHDNNGTAKISLSKFLKKKMTEWFMASNRMQ